MNVAKSDDIFMSHQTNDQMDKWISTNAPRMG
jgi:hypothetical protein